jgi:hypothetical protein
LRHFLYISNEIPARIPLRRAIVSGNRENIMHSAKLNHLAEHFFRAPSKSYSLKQAKCVAALVAGPGVGATEPKWRGGAARQNFASALKWRINVNRQNNRPSGKSQTAQCARRRA